MKSFRELRVWQSGMSLVERVYNLTRCFSKGRDFWTLKSTKKGSGICALKHCRGTCT